MKKNIKTYSFLILLASFVLIGTVAAKAQIVKNVVFAKGKYSATYKGLLPRTGRYDAYVIRARKGQQLTVNVITEDTDTFLQVYETKQLGPDEDLISDGEDHVQTWSGKLPITSEYSVQVQSSGEQSSRRPYTIVITIR